MNGTLYIPYVNTELDDNVFEYKGNAFDYINELNNAGNNIIGADYYFEHKPKNNTIRFGDINFNNSQYEQILYYELNCKFMDSDENDLSVITLINYFKTQESFYIIFSFDHDTTDENVLIELKSWISESKKVMDMPNNIYSDDIKMGLLPRRDFKVKSGKINAVLNDCLCFDSYDDKVIIFVGKIIFNN